MKTFVKRIIVWLAMRGFLHESLAMFLITILSLRGA